MNREWEEDIDRVMEEHPGRIQELEAQCAAMRLAILEELWAVEHPGTPESLKYEERIAALKASIDSTPEAGRALLERLEKLEAHRKTADALIQVEMKRAEKAEAALDLSEEFDQDWDEAVAMARVLTLEDAAKVAEDSCARGGCVGPCGAAIRALKGSP